jgi:hypothetical protein
VNPRIRTVVESVRRYRKHLVIAASVVALYALLGFFLAPWLIKKVAVDSVRDATGADLRLENVALNPFVLSLRINGVELDDPTGQAFASVDEIFINFQLSSLFRWAWTFDELRADAPQLFLSRSTDGALNVARFRKDDDATTAAEPSPPEGAPMPRLLVFDFAINRGAVRWKDEVPAETVDTEFGPVNIRVNQLNTLPEQSGEQAVVITTESSGTLSWNGSLQLNPLRSAGHAAIKGSHLPLTSAYLRHDIGFDFVEGDADVELDYTVSTASDGKLIATVDNFSFSLNDVLVRTFSGSDDVTDREVLKLPLLQIDGGTLRWPDRTVSIRSVSIDDAMLGVYRDESGNLNVVPKREPAQEGLAETDEAAPVESSGQPWKVALDAFAINRLVFALEDEAVQPTANIGISSFDLNISGINNEPATRFPTLLAIVFPSGGTASLDGEFSALPRPSFEFDMRVNKAALAAVHPYLKSLADVNLDSGTLDVAGKLKHDTDEALSFNGNLDVNDFLITETDQGSRLGSWVQFHLENIAFSATKETLEISEMRLDQPYGDIRIAKDGSVNLGRVTKDENGAQENEPETAAVEQQPSTPVEKEKSPLAATIGRVVVVDASADFEDQSLPLPFVAQIAELNGDITTIATDSREPSTVALEGKVDEFGFVRVTGSLTPLDPKLNTDLKVAFQNVEMPKFSAYTIPFAGREIASGKLDLELGYQVKASELVGENKLILRDFELGEKVEHPGAMSLPLGLAVALLKDAEGKIDVDLPVRGNVDDPEFKYGGVVLKALANLIVKIVASPFALLGKLVGVEANELEYINFIRGRADLTPPEQERIVKLAEALSLRPELVLEVSGVVDREADGIALRTAKLQQIVDARLGELAQDDDAMYAEQQRKILESLFIEHGVAAEQEIALEELESRFTSVVTNEETGTTETQFDALAYSNEIRRQLIELQPMTDSELAALANERSSNVRTALLAIDSLLESRIALGKAQAVEVKGDEPVKMKVTLAAN